MTHDHCRHYVVLNAEPDLTKNYFTAPGRKPDPGPDRDADYFVANYVHQTLYGSEINRDDPPFTTAARPSNEVFWGYERPADMQSRELVVALNIRRPKDVLRDIERAVAEQKILASSADIPFASSDHWCIGDAADPMFSDRSAAERLLRIDDLRTQSNTTGAGVNVVIVDEGLNKDELGASYGGGWTVGSSLPGTAHQQPGSVRRTHGMMMAHNILKVAPDALLFDLPLAPHKISNIMRFLSLADAAYRTVLSDINGSQQNKLPGSWMLVNPWGIYDRHSECPPGSYTTNRNNPFNQLVIGAVGDGIDVVFAAGNCGQFCPDFRCGGQDRGPASSIWGANSLKEVLTVGAVRADSMWLGYSSQGPGQPALGSNKPDLCATSQFCEDADAFSINTGTSAACGLAAGVVAALRSRWSSNQVPPGMLIQILNQSARKPPGLGWNNRLGYRLGNGVLDAQAAFDHLMPS